jgi:MOSC domain-containing protein YiiM
MKREAFVEHIHVASDAAAPVVSLESVEVRAGVGLLGDRYAERRGHYSYDDRISRDLTLVAAESLEAIQAAHGIELGPGETRRNLTTRGIHLNGLVGRRFYVGDVLCVGTGPCKPCQYLADLTGKPLLRPLVDHGGLRADLLSDGVIAVGDPISVAPSAEIVLGTMNVEKARQFEIALRGLDVTVRRLEEVAPDAPAVPEPLADPVANARRKSQAYGQLLGAPILALDFALFFDELDDEQQPGGYVRRFDRRREGADDEAVLRHYIALIARHGGALRGRWEVAIAFASANILLEASISVRRTFVATPSRRRVAGYPLASLQIDARGRYISELDPDALSYAEVAKSLRRLVARGVSSR